MKTFSSWLPPAGLERVPRTRAAAPRASCSTARDAQEDLLRRARRGHATGPPACDTHAGASPRKPPARDVARACPMLPRGARAAGLVNCSRAAGPRRRPPSRSTVCRRGANAAPRSRSSRADALPRHRASRWSSSSSAADCAAARSPRCRSAKCGAAARRRWRARTLDARCPRARAIYRPPARARVDGIESSRARASSGRARPPPGGPVTEPLKSKIRGGRSFTA